MGCGILMSKNLGRWFQKLVGIGGISTSEGESRTTFQVVNRSSGLLGDRVILSSHRAAAHPQVSNLLYFWLPQHFAGSGDGASHHPAMRAVIQRVSEASVTVEGVKVSEIGPGLLVLLGVEEGDTIEEAQWLAAKAIC